MISIIVPCFNAAQCLMRCVNSILIQEYSEWELLLIDDGSIDGTNSLCDQLKNEDDRIRVIHKQNGGVSSARNVGLDNAKGDYVCFVDADDYLLPDYFDNLLNGGIADLAICGFKSAEGIDITPQRMLLYGLDFANNVQRLVEDNFLLYSPWGKLFKKSIIGSYNLRFDPNIRLGEDTIFCYNYLLYCNSVKIVSSNSYFYDGVWGGGKKYALTRSEVEYLDRTEVDMLRHLNSHFGCNIDVTYRGYHALMLKGLYEQYTDVDIYNMYSQTHGNVGYKFFFSDNKLNCVFWSLVDLEILYKSGRIIEGRQMLRSLSHFYTLKCRKQSALSLKMLLWYFLIRHNALFAMHILLSLYAKIKR